MAVRVTEILHGINVEKNPRMSAKSTIVENGLGYEFFDGRVEKWVYE